VSLTVIVIYTAVTVEFILQIETIALNMTWSMTINAVSAVACIFLKIVVISSVLTAILV
jgi:hypothetical protein